MSANIPIGHYVAGESIVHRTDARVKLALAAAYTVALFLSTGWIGLSACAALAAAGYALARLPLALAFRGLKPMLYILVFTIALNAFTFDVASGSYSAAHDIALIGTFGFSPQGLANGLFFSLRIVLFAAATSLLTYTSPLIGIVDAIRSLISPLARFKVPVEDAAIVCAMTLRFIPATVEEAERIARAQQARGLHLDRTNPIARAKAWIPVVTPLFISLFKRADTLACALDARCYTGGRRTRLRSTRPTRADLLVCTFGIALLACIAMFL